MKNLAVALILSFLLFLNDAQAYTAFNINEQTGSTSKNHLSKIADQGLVSNCAGPEYFANVLIVLVVVCFGVIAIILLLTGTIKTIINRKDKIKSAKGIRLIHIGLIIISVTILFWISSPYIIDIVLEKCF